MHFCAGWISSDFFSTVPMSFFKLYFSTVILSGGGLLRSTIVSRGGRSPPQLITRVQGIVRWCDGGDAWENAVLSFLFLLLLLSLGCMKSLKWHQAVCKRVYRVLLLVSCFQILHLFVMSDMTPAKSSLVLVLYTGGTVGMKKLSENGMIPINL